MKTIEIKNFELYTTGVIIIAWTEKGEDIFLNVDLDLAALLKMLKIEGISYEKTTTNQANIILQNVCLKTTRLIFSMLK